MVGWWRRPHASSSSLRRRVLSGVREVHCGPVPRVICRLRARRPLEFARSASVYDSRNTRPTRVVKPASLTRTCPVYRNGRGIPFADVSRNVFFIKYPRVRFRDLRHRHWSGRVKRFQSVILYRLEKKKNQPHG